LRRAISTHDGACPLVHRASPVLVVGLCGSHGRIFHPVSEAEIVICELEYHPAPHPISFSKENYHVLQVQRTRMVYDDARHYISTRDKFDVLPTQSILVRASPVFKMPNW
jgi:hypothetical protein